MSQLTKWLQQLSTDPNYANNTALQNQIWKEIDRIITEKFDQRLYNDISSVLFAELHELDAKTIEWMAKEKIWLLGATAFEGKPSDDAKFKRFYAQYGLGTAVRQIRENPVANKTTQRPPTTTFLATPKQSQMLPKAHTNNKHQPKKTTPRPPLQPADREMMSFVNRNPTQSTSAAEHGSAKLLTRQERQAQQQAYQKIYFSLYTLLNTYLAHLGKKAPVDKTQLMFFYQSNTDQENSTPIQRKQQAVEPLAAFLPPAKTTTPEVLRTYQRVFREMLQAQQPELQIQNQELLATSRSFVTRENIEKGLKCGILPGLILLICAFFICCKSKFKSSKNAFTLDSHGAMFCRRTAAIFDAHSEIFTSPQISAG